MNSCFILGIKSESHISECLTGFEIFLVLYWFQVCNRLTLLLQIICNPLTPSESVLQCISCNKFTSLCHMSENDMQNPWKNHIFITKFLTVYHMWVTCSYAFNTKYQGVHAQLTNSEILPIPNCLENLPLDIIFVYHS